MIIENLLNELFEKLQNKKEEMIKHTRWLHEHPELSFEEIETSKYIANHYADKDVKV